MYLNPQIHDTQDTFPVAPEIRILHVFRMCIPYVSRMYLDYLLGYMYAACILNVSRMSPSYQIRRSLDAFEIHVSHDVFQVYPACILITSADTCIPNVSRMYLACILHLSYVPHWIYSRYAFQIVSRMYPVQDTCIVILYLGVS